MNIYYVLTALSPCTEFDCRHFSGMAVRESPGAEPIDGSCRLEAEILGALGETAALTRTRLRERLSVNNDRLGRTLIKFEQEGRVRRGGDGWSRASP
jgi:hypothetical protein